MRRGDRRAGAAAARPPRRIDARPTRRGRSSTGCCDDNYVLLGVDALHASGPTASRTPTPRPRSASSRTRRCCPSCSPGLMEVQRTHLRPAATDERIIDIDYCANAPGHPPPRADRRRRDPRVGRRRHASQASTLLLGRFAKGAFTAKPQDIPLLEEKLAWLLEQLRRRAELARLPRDARALQPLPASASCSTPTPPSLKDDHRPHGLHVGRRRDRGRRRGTRPGLRRGVGGVLATCATRTQVEEDLKRGAAARRSARSRSAPGPTWAPMALLVFYFDADRARAPDRRRRRCARMTRRA